MMTSNLFLQNKGIISQQTCHYTYQQNGVAKKKNKHLVDIVRALFLESSVSSKFWVEALTIAVHLINSLLSPKS